MAFYDSTQLTHFKTDSLTPGSVMSTSALSSICTNVFFRGAGKIINSSLILVHHHFKC